MTRDSGRMLGNFPQAFSHVALINSAHNLWERDKPAEKRSGLSRVLPGELGIAG